MTAPGGLSSRLTNESSFRRRSTDRLARASAALTPEFLTLAERLPAALRSEFQSLVSEPDGEVFFSGLLALGRRAIQNDQAESAQYLLQAIAQAEGSAGAGVAARAELEALRGAGPWSRRAENTGRAFVRQAADPAMIAGMGVAGIVAGSLRLGVLSRLAASPEATFFTRGLGARLTASVAVFGPEVGAFWATERGIRGLLHPGPLAWDGDTLLREFASLGITLGALKLGGWGATQSFGARGPWVRQVGLLGGILAGRRAEEAFGLRPGADGSSRLADALATLLQFNVAGRLASRALGPGHAVFLESLEAQARRVNASPRSPLFPGGAFAVTPEGVRLPLSDRSAGIGTNVMMMENKGPNGSNGSGSRAPAERASSPARTSSDPFIAERIQRIRWSRLFLERRLAELFPELISEEGFSRRLSELPRWDAALEPYFAARVRAYLGEEGLARFRLEDPAVQASVRSAWRNARAAGLSPGAQHLLAHIEEAQEILESLNLPDHSPIRPSHLEASPGLSRVLGRDIYLLNDAARPTGSFKERGAIVEVLRAADAGAIHFVTASHGNHGLAVALASQILGLRSLVVVPDTTPRVKIERLRGLGATVVETGEQPHRGYEEARDWGLHYATERNWILENHWGIRGAVHYVHGFEDVIPGQGVAGLEILDQIDRMPPEIRERLVRGAFLIPMGGGGLAAGVATALRSRLPDARIFGIASDQAPALHHSLLTGTRSEVFLNEKSLCDSGIGLTVPGARPFEILRSVLDGSLVVSDASVGEAMRLIHRHHGAVVEGGAATGIAAHLSGRLAELGVEPDAPLISILTGGNIDASRHEAVMAGREAPWEPPSSPSRPSAATNALTPQAPSD